jgi:hypothetical protein
MHMLDFSTLLLASYLNQTGSAQSSMAASLQVRFEQPHSSTAGKDKDKLMRFTMDAGVTGNP